MEVLSYNALDDVTGGGKTLWYIIGGLSAFLAGVFSGFMNPRACNTK